MATCPGAHRLTQTHLNHQRLVSDKSAIPVLLLLELSGSITPGKTTINHINGFLAFCWSQVFAGLPLRCLLSNFLCGSLVCCSSGRCGQRTSYSYTLFINVRHYHIRMGAWVPAHVLVWRPMCGICACTCVHYSLHIMLENQLHESIHQSSNGGHLE